MIYRNQKAVADASNYLAQTAMRLNPVELCNPTNLDDLADDWKKCALTDHFPNPQFKYDTFRLGNAAILGVRISKYWNTILYNCTPENEIDSAILTILENRVKTALLTSDLASFILREEDANSQKAILEIYGRPSGSFITRCYDALEHPSSYFGQTKSRFGSEAIAALTEKQYKAADIHSVFTKVLEYYGFKDWQCILDPKTKTIDARDKTEDGHPKLVIPHRRKVNGLTLAKLIGHEIESHIRGSENSRDMFRNILNDSPLLPLAVLLAKSDDERFYEGVAKISDIEIEGDKAMPSHFYTIAIHLALDRHQGFDKVASTMFALNTTGSSTRESAANEAWKYARRIFRGATNTSTGFAFTKDYGYLEGYEAALNAPASYYDYSSMTLDEIKLLEDAGVDLSMPRYPKRDAVRALLGIY